MVLVPLATGVVALVFAAFVLVPWFRRRSPYRLAWGIGLAMFAVAAFAGYLHRIGTGTTAEYDVFYLFGALLNVPWLALGTVFLLAPRRAANIALAIVVLFSAVSIFAVLSTPVNAQAVADTGKGFPDGSLPRILAFVANAVGSLVLIGGALWSAWRFSRTRTLPRRALANILIAVGVFIVAAGGTVAFTGTGGVLEFTNLGGLAVMFAGFLLA